MKRYMDANNIFHYDEMTGDSFVQTIERVDPLLDANKKVQADNVDFSTHGKDMVKVASLDPVTYVNLLKEGIIDDPKAFKKWLNDPDNRYFRTNTIKV